MLRQVTDSFGLPLAYRYIAQHGAKVEAISALPTRETCFDGEHLAVFTTSLELDDLAGARQRSRADRVANGKSR